MLYPPSESLKLLFAKHWIGGVLHEWKISRIILHDGDSSLPLAFLYLENWRTGLSVTQLKQQRLKGVGVLHTLNIMLETDTEQL